MEVLLVIALLVLIAAMTGLWVQRSLSSTGARPPQEVLLAAVAQARVLAMQQGYPVLLTFDEQAQGFALSVLDADNPGGVAVSGDQSLPWLERSDLRVVAGTAESPPRTGAPAADDTGAAAMPRQGGARFFALPEGSHMRVTFNLLYGEQVVALPTALEGIRFHPSGASTPVQVQMEDTATGYRQVLLPDSLAGGLRLDERGRALAGDAGRGRQ